MSPLNARIARTMPNPLFGTLVTVNDAPTASASPSPAASPRRWPALPVTALLLLLLAALWPHLAWSARRLADGSDEPWGVLALVTVLVLVWRDRAGLITPAPRALGLSAALAVLAGVALWWLPPLAAAAIAMLALARFLTAALPRRPATPMLTLLLLSLPIIASLQFYLGYPLRAATATAAVPLLALFGIDAQAAGAALVFRDLTVLVDAPCAGIGMLWVGAYTAALLSYLNGASALRTLGNGAAAAVIVFAANVLRNVALFFPEAGLIEAPSSAHGAIGLAAFALALLPIIRLTQWRSGTSRPEPALVRTPQASRITAPYVGACLAAAVVPLVAMLVPGVATPAARSTAQAAIEWPTTYRGQPLTQLALTPLEARFAQRFPGVIARFSAGRELLVLRHVTQPTRQLHPASDCFRAAGFAIDAPRAHRDAEGRGWTCFMAARDGERLRVCEAIERADGGAGAPRFTDVSAWYWAALRDRGVEGRTPGWWATTVITPLPSL